MKKILGTILLFTFSACLFAQQNIKGQILNSKTKEALPGVTITLSGNNYATTTSTNNEGFFEFSGISSKGKFQLMAEHISMKSQTISVDLPLKINEMKVWLEPNIHFLEPLEVRSIRASYKAPFAKTDLTAQQIEKNNLGRDLPFILDQTPSVVVNSDAGNGVGYTGIRIRGSDASRINVTLNGIPFNDPESQGTFFVDMPDFVSSVGSIQVQRGVGTSSNGAGAFGATINLSTNEFTEKAYGELNNSFGTFNTWKNTVKAGSGLINDHFTIDARLSRISSDGYIDRASSNMQSFYLSGAYIAKKANLRFNIFSGKEKTYQAWYGVSENLLQTNRTFNSAGMARPGGPYDNETDNYQQDHYQFFYNQSVNSHVKFNTAVYLVKGKGFYEQYRANQKFSSYGLGNPVINGSPVTRTDLIRQLWLDNDMYGQIFSLIYKKKKDELIIGGGWNTYEGGHYGKIIWAGAGIPKDYKWYDVPGLKKDANIYTKWMHTIDNKWSLFGDVQYRHVSYTMNGFRNNPSLKIERKFDFLNPKAGISYNHKGLQAFFSYAQANKEPNRNDFEAKLNQQPKREKLHDFELGVEKRKANYSVGATLYYMAYKDQLILTGQINDVGAYTRINVPKSYRAGIELVGNARLASWVNAAANLSLSRNKIQQSEEFIDNYDNGGQLKIVHAKTDIAFSPAMIGGATVNFLPLKNMELSLIGKYVGRQYLDNTQNEGRSLQPYYVQDVRFIYTLKEKLFKETKLVAQVNNIFNKKYEPNGYTFSYIAGGTKTTENYYFPMAGTNVMIGLNISL